MEIKILKNGTVVTSENKFFRFITVDTEEASEKPIIQSQSQNPMREDE